MTHRFHQICGGDEWADSTKLGKNAPTGAELLQLIDGSCFPQLKALDWQGFRGHCASAGAVAAERVLRMPTTT
jgi:hypothetical protein